jgi:hypothetical protein
MLWKPLAPIYPRVVQNVAEGLTFEETKEMRNRGLNSPPLMKLSKLKFSTKSILNHISSYCHPNGYHFFVVVMFLSCAARNGVYVNVVEKVREAFKTLEVVRLDCSHTGTSDCKKIGVKLRVCCLRSYVLL